jgi:hypothetical protein
MTEHDREARTVMFRQRGAGAIVGAPLLRPIGRSLKGRLPQARDRETEELLFQPGGWPEFQNVWREPEPDILKRRPCGCAPERDTLHNEFIMRRLPVPKKFRRAPARPGSLPACPP